MKLKNTNILLAILTSKKNTKRCDQKQNFSLSIKLVDKNHIIYNKKSNKYTKSIQFDERKKKITCKVVGRAERRKEKYSK